MYKRSVIVALLITLRPGALTHAQNGDRKNDPQTPLPDSLEIPRSPALTPDQALESFTLPPGLSIELAAGDPLVQDPVCMAFDGDGRMWVAEMIAYMPNIDGTGEEEPNGRIAVLTDTDGDGLFDARVNFLEGLVLPRAVLPYREGALVISPPLLSYHSDTDGDGVADHEEVIARGLGGLHSPEHAINGLRWTHDNWIHCANHNLRFRETDKGWITQRTGGGGQWGLTFDEEGRLFYNTNSDPLRGDSFSSHYAVRNTNFGRAVGTNVRVAHDHAVWPGRINPGVNRGYQEPTLREDFTLARFTGACGPLIYLGGAFPEEYHGNAFVAEPCGNLVKRYSLHPSENLFVEARNVYAGREFLVSTDERFRPVNIYDGPDGSIYVVDLYRGLLQHRIFLTTFLRNQSLDRELDKHIHMGRIWRIKHDGMRPTPVPKLLDASWTELTDALHSPNGWVRLTAQQLIVQDGADDADAIELTHRSLFEGPTALGRLHALWTLEGLGVLDVRAIERGLEDPDPRVQRAAVRCSELLLSTGAKELVAPFSRLASGVKGRLKRQLLYSLGQANTPFADSLMVTLLHADASDEGMRTAVLSGIAGRELRILVQLMGMPGSAEPGPGRAELVRELARCIVTEQRHAAMDELSTMATALDPAAGGESPWLAEAMIEGMLSGRPKDGKGNPSPIRFSSRPSAYRTLKLQAESQPDSPHSELLEWITWPGGPNASGEPLRALTVEEQASFDRGRELYLNACASCHQSSGRGAGGLAPSLRYSPWLIADKATPLRILLGGLSGEIEVQGQTWDLEMPVYDSSPQDVADVLTYARREWGHGAEPVTVRDVNAILREIDERDRVWTPEELKAEQERQL